MLTLGKTQTHQNYKIESYGRLDTLDTDLFKVTNKRIKETWEGMTQWSLMMNLNKSLFSLNYPEPNLYKPH